MGSPYLTFEEGHFWTDFHVSASKHFVFWFQNEARKLNHQEVVEEDKRLKLPANWEAKKARLEWELQEEEKKKVRNPSAVFTSGLLSLSV